MVWKFIEDIAVYDDGSYVMIVKVKLVRFDGGYDTDLTQIYHKGEADAQTVARLMTQLGEDIREYGFDKFQIYIHCEVCDTLFLQTSKNRSICSGKCKVRKFRESKNKKKAQKP